MRLKSLHLKNFLSHRDTRLEFPEGGITLIVGPNASGKSSLFDAVRFALFGPRAGKPSLLMTNGQDHMGVVLEFLHNGHVYRVSREYARKSRGDVSHVKSRVTEDGVLVAEGGVRDVDVTLIKGTRFTHEIFRYSVMAIQGEIEGVLELRPKERVEALEHMLGYHHARMVAEAAAELARREERDMRVSLSQKSVESPAQLEARIKEKKEALEAGDRELDRIRKKEKDAEAEEARLRERVRALRKEEEEIRARERERERLMERAKAVEREMARLEKEISQAEDKLKALSGLREKLRDVSARIEKLQELREERDLLFKGDKLRTELEAERARARERAEYERRARDLLARHEDFGRTQDELKHLAGRFAELKEKMGRAEATSQSLSEAEREAEDLEKRLAEMGDLPDRQHLESERDALRRELSRLVKEAGAAEEAEKRAKKDAEEIRSIKGTCPLCKQDLSPEHKKEILGRLRTEAETQAQRARALREEIETRNKRLKEVEDLAESIAKKAHLEERLTRTRNIIKRARRELEELAGAQQEFKNITERTKALEKRLKALEKDEKEYLAARSFLERNPAGPTEKRIKALKEQIEELEAKRRLPGASLEEIERKIASLAPLEKEAGALTERIKELEALGEDLEKKRGERTRKQAELLEIREKLKRAGDLGERRKELARALEDLDARGRELAETRSELRARAAALQKEAQAARESLEDDERVLEFVLRKGDHARLFSDISETLSSKQGIEREFYRSMLMLQDSLDRYFKEFGFANFNYVRFADLKDLEPVIVDSAGQSIERPSGGQRVAMGLAMRFAISRTLSGAEAEALFLDEPTPHLDDERITELRDLLENFKLHPSHPQVIVITHDEDMKAVADSVIELRQRGGFSNAVLVQ